MKLDASFVCLCFQKEKIGVSCFKKKEGYLNKTYSAHTRNPWALQWKGLNQYYAGVFRSSKKQFLRGQDY